MRAAITSMGHYLPPDVLDNAFFASHLDTTDEWIRARTGISERHVNRDGGTSDMIVPAARQCLARRGITAEDIDCILVATVTPDYVFPSTAAVVQAKLQATHAWGFDLAAACCGFIMALAVATRFVETGAARTVLVCGADKMTTLCNYEDRASSVLFGDAAGVALVEQSADETVGIVDHVAHLDGRHVNLLYVPAGGSVRPASHETIARKEHYLIQAGAAVFKAATAGMVEVTQEVLNRNGLEIGDLQWLVPHQANKRIMDAVAKTLRLSSSRVMCNIDRYGNTSSATIPLCLSEWMQKNELHKGDNIVLTSFGAGYITASLYLRWAVPARQGSARGCYPLADHTSVPAEAWAV